MATFDKMEFECFIAAILTSGALGSEPRNAANTRVKYAQILKELRTKGTVYEPSASLIEGE